jgi:SAM-dependent methyltransferase
MGSYFLKEGYRERPAPEYFVDFERKIEGQPHVYPIAADLARRLGCRKIIDIGCGYSRKLVVLHPEFEIVGLDFGPNIDHCREHYPFGTWISWDIEHEPLPELDAAGSVVVCADVIEHLVDPQILLVHLRTLLEQAATGLLSTPERDLIHGEDHYGPPPNRCHAREWNMAEFEAFLVSAGLAPVRLELTQSGDRSPEKMNILATLPGALLGAGRLDALCDEKHPSRSGRG